MTPHEEVERIVDNLRKAPYAEQCVAIWEIFRSSHDGKDPVLPIRVGGTLRNRSQFELADYVLRIGLRVPGLEDIALFELSLTEAARGNAAGSVEYMEKLRARRELNPYQMRHMAIQLARMDLFERAEAMLEEIVRRDRAWRQECVIIKQFLLFLKTFDYSAAMSIYATLVENNPVLSTEQTEYAVLEALSRNKPFALIRSGDGEGAHTRISLSDEAQFPNLYRANRMEFLDIWFRRPQLVDSEDWGAVMDEYDQVVMETDVWGGFHREGIEHQYQICSRRGVPSVLNIARKAASLSASDVKLADPTIHYRLLFSGALGRLLSERPRVGLISCHDQLPNLLKSQFSIGSIEFLKIPGEQIHHEVLGAAATEGEHFPHLYRELLEQLKKVRAGDLWLVAAGLLGKIYCREIRKRGSVVLDIGAVADIWMGKATRNFPEHAASHDLTRLHPSIQ